MGDRLFEHGHSRLRVRRNIRPEATGICVRSSVRDESIDAFASQSNVCRVCVRLAVLKERPFYICLQSRSRTVACVVWRNNNNNNTGYLLHAISPKSKEHIACYKHYNKLQIHCCQKHCCETLLQLQNIDTTFHTLMQQ